MGKLANFVTHFPVIIGITGVFTYITASLLMNVALNENLIILAFFYPYFLYSINRLSELEEDKINYPERYIFIKNHKLFFIITSIVAFSISLYFAFFNWKIMLLIIIILIFLLLYSIENEKFPRLKKIFLLKNFVTSSLWSIGLCLLPLFVYENVSFLSLIFVIIFIFFRTFQDTILCDIRDIHGDKKNKINTLPIAIGKKKTIFILFNISFISFVMILLGSFFGIVSKAGYMIFILFFYDLFVLRSVTSKNLKFVSEVMSDAEYIIMGILALLAFVWL